MLWMIVDCSSEIRLGTHPVVLGGIHLVLICVALWQGVTLATIISGRFSGSIWKRPDAMDVDDEDATVSSFLGSGSVDLDAAVVDHLHFMGRVVVVVGQVVEPGPKGWELWRTAEEWQREDVGDEWATEERG